MTVISLFKFEPETVNDCAADAVPATVLNAANAPPVTLTDAPPAAFTVPLTATFAGVAPVLVKVTLADASDPAAVPAALRTEMVLLSRVVPLLARVWFDAKLVPSCETSNPAGAVTVTSAVKFEPVTAKV